MLTILPTRSSPRSQCSLGVPFPAFANQYGRRIRPRITYRCSNWIPCTFTNMVPYGHTRWAPLYTSSHQNQRMMASSYTLIWYFWWYGWTHLSSSDISTRHWRVWKTPSLTRLCWSQNMTSFIRPPPPCVGEPHLYLLLYVWYNIYGEGRVRKTTPSLWCHYLRPQVALAILSSEEQGIGEGENWTYAKEVLGWTVDTTSGTVSLLDWKFC